MSFCQRISSYFSNPVLLMVALGVALYPFVKDEKSPHVLRLTESQKERALHAERGRSDAPETADRRRAALSDALGEEALAQYALSHELHREDDALRGLLAAASLRALLRDSVDRAPSDDDLRAFASTRHFPVENLVDVQIAPIGGRSESGLDGGTHEGTDAGSSSPPQQLDGIVLSEAERALGISHLPMPTDEALIVETTTMSGQHLRVQLRVHNEPGDRRFARMKPELLRRYAEEATRARSEAIRRALRDTYDRVEEP